MKYALLHNGNFLKFTEHDPNRLPRLSVGYELLPVVDADPVEYEDETENRASAYERQGGNWVRVWTVTDKTDEEKAAWIARNYPPAESWRVHLWLLKKKGVTRDHVMTLLAQAVPADDLAEAVMRYDRVPIVPIDHPLTVTLATAYSVNLRESWAEISSFV